MDCCKKIWRLSIFENCSTENKTTWQPYLFQQLFIISFSKSTECSHHIISLFANETLNEKQNTFYFFFALEFTQFCFCFLVFPEFNDIFAAFVYIHYNRISQHVAILLRRAWAREQLLCFFPAVKVKVTCSHYVVIVWERAFQLK